MPAPAPNQHNFDSRHHRLTPSLPEYTAPLLILKHSQQSGFGVFASQSIQPDAQLLDTEVGEKGGPAVYVIYRAFRKEVCAWCFRYEEGKNWKIRFDSGAGGTSSDYGSATSSNTGPGPGLVFCRETCKDAWKDYYGDIGIEAYIAVETFAQKQARCRGWAVEIYGEDEESVPSWDEINEAWQSAEDQASLIRALRLQAPSSSKTKPSTTKVHRQALARATSPPVLNTDTLFFLLSGILCAASSPSSWNKLLALNPSLHSVYTNTSTLHQTTSTFLHLTSILPPSLLSYVTREALEATLARDIGNSFGIWSTRVESDTESNHQSANPSDGPEMVDGGAEMLGYGIWPVASFFNHSCAPNVSRRRLGRRWIFSSAREVSKGEELCISYIRGEEDTLNLAERRKRLKDAWGFTCRCVKCLREE